MAAKTFALLFIAILGAEANQHSVVDSVLFINSQMKYHMRYEVVKGWLYMDLQFIMPGTSVWPKDGSTGLWMGIGFGPTMKDTDMFACHSKFTGDATADQAATKCRDFYST